MRLIILNQYFYPDYAATSLLMTELAEGLADRGVSITAVAGRGLYRGGAKLSKSDVHKNIRIERCWATSFGKNSIVGRVCDYLSFYCGAMWTLLRIPRHDVIMTLTTPPLIGSVALLVARLRGMRVIALEQDVYPDVAIALGALKQPSISTRILMFISKTTLRRSDGIIALSECMRRRIIDKLPGTSRPPIHVIHNWADGGTIRPSGRSNWFTARHRLDEYFVVLFAGNLGRVNDFTTALEAAYLVKDYSQILFVFIGDGDRATEIRAFQQKNQLTNIRMLPYHPPAQMGDILASAHVSLVTLRAGLAGLSVPSKTYGSLAAGRPIVFVGDLQSEIAELIVTNKCGAAVASGESRKLADILCNWASDSEQLKRLSVAARQLFERRFDRSQAVDAYLQAFRKSVDGDNQTRTQRAS